MNVAELSNAVLTMSVVSSHFLLNMHHPHHPLFWPISENMKTTKKTQLLLLRCPVNCNQNQKLLCINWFWSICFSTLIIWDLSRFLFFCLVTWLMMNWASGCILFFISITINRTCCCTKNKNPSTYVVFLDNQLVEYHYIDPGSSPWMCCIIWDALLSPTAPENWGLSFRVLIWDQFSCHDSV